MRRSLFSKVCMLLAVCFVIFQSFMLSFSLAVSPWTGDSWTGESWTGQSWQGEKWQGESWESETHSNKGIISEDRNNGSTIPPSLEEKNPFPPYYNNPFLPYQPSLGIGDKNLLDDSPLPTIERKETKEGEDIGLWDVASYIGDDIINGQVDFAVGLLEQGDNVNLTNTFARPNFFTGLILNGAKIPLGEKAPPWFDMMVDVHDGAGMAFDIYDGYTDLFRGAYGTSAVINDGLEVLPTVLNTSAPVYGALTKFNIATSAVSTGFSLVNAVKSVEETLDVFSGDASSTEKVAAGAETASDLGELIFNAGMLTAAFPGAQTVGLGIAVVGGAIWLAGKGVKWAANNWSSISDSKVGKAVKGVWEGIKKPFRWLTGS